jgi:hypothetical protein
MRREFIGDEPGSGDLAELRQQGSLEAASGDGQMSETIALGVAESVSER